MLRRDFLLSATTVIGFLPIFPTSRRTTNTAYVMDNEVVKIKVGRLTCTLFLDLTFKYLAKDFFINASQDELNTALARYNIQPGDIPSPFIAALIEDDKRKILIDSGVGHLEKPLVFRGNSYMFKGRLLQLLAKENISNDDITDVIITHFHPDHIGGVYAEDGKLNFAKATFHMPNDEWDYWHSSKSDDQPALFKYFIGKNISPLEGLNLNLIKGDFVELFPGITAVKADGHTPGQIALIIHSENERLLYISDAFLHPLHIEKLDWQTNYDLDHQKAKQTRMKLIDLAYKDSMLVNAFHFDFPGLGRIDKSGNNWKWNYSGKNI